LKYREANYDEPSSYGLDYYVGSETEDCLQIYLREGMVDPSGVFFFKIIVPTDLRPTPPGLLSESPIGNQKHFFGCTLSVRRAVDLSLLRSLCCEIPSPAFNGVAMTFFGLPVIEGLLLAWIEREH
jgi:hypothetical protein